MKFILYVLSSLIACTTVAQNKRAETSFYVFDSEWKPCKPEEAVFLAAEDILNDSCYRWQYYKYTGPLVRVETYKDKDATIPHGFFAYYDANGRIDSSGYSNNGKKDKEWKYYTDSFTVYLEKTYENGKMIEQKDAATIQLEQEEWEEKYKNNSTEAHFKGKDQKWINYLTKNLKYADRAIKLDKEGTVRILFLVDTDGSPGTISLFSSVEYSLDREAERLIKQSPKWEAAIVNGKPARAWRVQPITFRLR